MKDKLREWITSRKLESRFIEIVGTEHYDNPTVIESKDDMVGYYNHDYGLSLYTKEEWEQVESDILDRIFKAVDFEDLKRYWEYDGYSFENYLLDDINASTEELWIFNQSVDGITPVYLVEYHYDYWIWSSKELVFDFIKSNYDNEELLKLVEMWKGL